MAKLPYLYDEKFLLEMDNLRLRHQYAKITVLDFMTEKTIEDITGRVTSGSISLNGDSCVRRTANLTFVIDDPEYFNLFKVSNLLSINKKIELSIGLENTTNKYKDYPIIWYPQGTYVITSPSISYSTSGLTVGLQLKDKMCLLNGDCGGVLPAQTTLSEIEDVDASGATIITYPTIYQIIQELVNHFGGEQLGKIIINDLGERTYQIMRSISATPIYAHKTSAENESYTFDNDPEGEDDLVFYSSEPICYSPTDFTYPGELIVQAGATVTSVLDTIKNTLGGNFEYFYDIEGNFVFQEIKNYLNTSQATILNNIKNKDNTGKALNEAYAVIRDKGKAVYSFKDSPLIISYNVTPNYLNIKNDFLVWGTRTTVNGLKIPIRYHLAIDKRPEIVTFENVFIYLSNIDGDKNVIKAQIPLKLPYQNIDRNGIGTSGIVYQIGTPDNYQFYVWSEDAVDYIEVTDVGKLKEKYRPVDWRTVLYLQGSLGDQYGTDSNYYYIELKNEWPKLYDLRPRQRGGYHQGDDFYFDTEGEGQSFWSYVTEDPTSIDYYLDFIDSGAAISEFSVGVIGRRQKVIQDDDINCIFEPSKFCNTVAIKEETEGLKKQKMQEEIKQCLLDGRDYSKVDANIYDFFVMGSGFFSAYETIRSALQEWTDYNESIQLTCVPIFHLEPNTRITVENRNLNINGDYMMRSLSIPLGGGTMSISANKVVEKL